VFSTGRCKAEKGIQKMSISVVITHYNKGDLLKNALMSLEQQTCQEFSVVVIDDASSDEVSKKCFSQCKRRYIGNKKFTFMDNLKNMGATATINRAIENCTGQLIMLLDADDTLPVNTVKIIRKAFLHYPDTDLFFGDYLRNGQLISCVQLSNAAGYLDFKKLASSFKLLGTTPFTRQLWLKCGKFNPKIRINYDLDFFLRGVSTHGFSGRYVPHVIYKWDMEQGGMSTGCPRYRLSFMFFRHIKFFKENMNLTLFIKQLFFNFIAIPLDFCGIFRLIHPIYKHFSK
jgi:glycosyltransferase involved in cell wall biosynthesis